jgi:hypothetical protein
MSLHVSEGGTMADMQIYALKGDPDTAKDVYASLKEGVGRFGWSYTTDDAGNPLGDADLKRLKAKIEATGWTSLLPMSKLDTRAFYSN